MAPKKTQPSATGMSEAKTEVIQTKAPSKVKHKADLKVEDKAEKGPSVAAEEVAPEAEAAPAEVTEPASE